MNVDNETPFETKVVRDSASELVGSVFARTRIVHQLSGDSISLSRDQGRDFGAGAPWPRVDPFAAPSRVEVVVQGAVTSARSAFCRRDLILVVGAEQRRLAVFGPRAWVERGEDVVPGEPTPTSSVEMSWGLSYGGRHRRPPGLVEASGLPGPTTEVAWPANPGGIGFHRTAKEAIGNAVPQVESAHELVTCWDHRPQPACWAPLPPDSNLYPAQRAMEGHHARLRGELELDPAIDRPHLAAPDMQFAIAPDTRVDLHGFLDEAVSFDVPPAPFRWQAWTADLTLLVEPELTHLFLLPNDGCVVLFYRTTIHVPLIRYESRRVAQIPVNEGLLPGGPSAG